MYEISAVTFMNKIPAMPIVVLYILTVIYHLNTIVSASDPECVTNSTDDNKNKYPAPDYIVSINSHSFKSKLSMILSNSFCCSSTISHLIT